MFDCGYNPTNLEVCANCLDFLENVFLDKKGSGKYWTGQTACYGPESLHTHISRLNPAPQLTILVVTS